MIARGSVFAFALVAAQVAVITARARLVARAADVAERTRALAVQNIARASVVALAFEVTIGAVEVHLAH